MKPIYTLLIIIAVIFTMWTAAALRIPDTATASPLPITLTPEMLEGIQPGMTIDQVESIIGAPAISKESATSPGGTHTDRLYWKDAKGQSLYIRFINGKMDSTLSESITTPQP